MGIGGQILQGKVVVRAPAGEEMLREEHDVLATVTQGRQRERDHRQPVVEIFPEVPVPYRGRQVLVGGRDDLDIGGLAQRAAEPAHRLLLDDLQELGLKSLGEEPDFIEKDRAVVRGLEEPRLRARRVGERPLLEAEQFRLEQGRGDRGTVDLDEGAVAPRTIPVDQFRNEALARSRLALQKDRWVPTRPVRACE